MRIKSTIIMVVLAIPMGAAFADYSGSLVSASADSPMVLGNSLDFTVTVQNTGSDDWFWWSYPTWSVEVHDPSWSPPWSDITYWVWHDVNAGALDTYTPSLSASNLPSTAGNYSFNVYTACMADDWGGMQWMSNIPITVNFSILENQDPVADLTGDAALPTPGDGHYEAYPMGDANRHNWLDGDKIRINDWWCAYTVDDTYKVTLDGSDSSDPDGTIVSWDWAVDPSGLNYTATGETADVTLDALLAAGFQEYQTYELKLTVEDDLGATDVATGYLTVVPEPGTMALLALGGLALIRRRAHAWRR